MYIKKSKIALGFILIYFLMMGLSRPVHSGEISDIKTQHEVSNFINYTSHKQLEKFINKLQKKSDQIKVLSYGKSLQGRNLPIVIFSKEGIKTPHEAHLTKRPIILLGANIHGDERTLRESSLLLMRELAIKGSKLNSFLNEIIVIFTPTLNPDGFEASKKGTRRNSLGIDMNRDYMKLEQMSLIHFVQKVLQKWKPHLWVDGHNGGRFPYHISYLCSSNAAVNKEILGFCDNKLLPFINKDLKRKKYRSFYYKKGNKTEWTIGGHKTRIGRNYGGLLNIISVLFESPNWQSHEIGAKSGLAALKSVIRFSSFHKDEILNITKRAKRETIDEGLKARGNIVVKMKYEAMEKPVSYLIGGKKVGSKRKIIKIKNAKIIRKIVPVKLRPRPYAYLLKPQFNQSIDLIRRHNIKVNQLSKDQVLNVDVYKLDKITYKPLYDHKKAVTVTLGETLTKDVFFPKGSYYLKTGQELGKLLEQLMEPETSDNIIKWNTMDFALPKKVGTSDHFEIPIYKLQKQLKVGRD
ncbi:M14 family zinc carboxypeptidase [Bacteriovoracales bacterium]|nr:M14 family zinc carboxypeptidase [Bacteriovoracales bacterium]